MFKRLCLAFVIALAPAAAAPALGGEAPAGYILDVDLRGVDQAPGAVVRRAGRDIAAGVLTALFAGDEIVLRDAASRIMVMGGDGQTVAAAGGRFAAAGAAPDGGDAWRLVGAVSAAVHGGDEAAEGYGASGEGGDLRIPMAVPGPNFIVKDGNPLWLAWSGGAAPYKVIVDVDGRAKVYDRIKAREFEFMPPPAPAGRFAVTIKDSDGKRLGVVLRYRNGLPVPNEGFTGRLPDGPAQEAVHAAWLTSLHEGDWSIEAVQLLRRRAATDPLARALLPRIVAGWKFQRASR